MSSLGLRRYSSVHTAMVIQWLLHERGFYAARHSSSVLVMYDDVIIASIHVYGSECLVNINSLNKHLVPGSKLVELLEVVENECNIVEKRVVP